MDAYSQKFYLKIWFIWRLTLKDYFSAFKVDFLGFPPYMCTTAILQILPSLAILSPKVSWQLITTDKGSNLTK